MNFNIIENATVKGLYVCENVINNENDIIQDIDNRNWLNTSNEPYTGYGRKVQHYGYMYDYKHYKITKDNAFEYTPVITELQNTLKNICKQQFNKEFKFDQCIVNNYEPGQGISKHKDIFKFDNVIGCYTLLGGATMIFRNGDQVYEHYAKPNSLYIMSGDARNLWTHEMSSNKFDTVDNIKTKRTRRLSITFRTVK